MLVCWNGENPVLIFRKSSNDRNMGAVETQARCGVYPHRNWNTREAYREVMTDFRRCIPTCCKAINRQGFPNIYKFPFSECINISTIIYKINVIMSASYYWSLYLFYRHLYEQDMLLADCEVSIQQFDSRVRQLQRERIRVQVGIRLFFL